MQNIHPKSNLLAEKMHPKVFPTSPGSFQGNFLALNYGGREVQREIQLQINQETPKLTFFKSLFLQKSDFRIIPEELKSKSLTLWGKRWAKFGCIRINSSLSSQGDFSAFLRVSSYFTSDFNSINRTEGRNGPVPIPKLKGSVQQAQDSTPKVPKSFSRTSFL